MPQEADGFILGIPPRSGTPNYAEVGKLTSVRESEVSEVVARMVETALGIPRWKQEGCERCGTCVPRFVEMFTDWSFQCKYRYALLFKHLPHLLSMPQALDFVVDRVLVESANKQDLGRDFVAVFTHLIDEAIEESLGWQSGQPATSPLPVARLSAIVFEHEKTHEMRVKGPLDQLGVRFAKGPWREKLAKLQAHIATLNGELLRTFGETATLREREAFSRPDEPTRRSEKRVLGGGLMRFTGQSGSGQPGRTHEATVVDISLRHILAITSVEPPHGSLDAVLLVRPHEMPISVEVERTGRRGSTASVGHVKPTIQEVAAGRLREYWVFSVRRAWPYYYYCLLCKYLWSRRNSQEEQFVDRFGLVEIPPSGQDFVVTQA
ncbi:MAG TPA: hypothetical protein VNA25_09365 [Phycisphaerae bacterium]|nr:hypothetical protein [Phycisphaerae bacterium]